MNFLADESVDFPIVSLPRKKGHFVKSILEDSPGSTDELVLKVAAEAKLILITCDKDFGELIFRLKQNHTGVILLRLESISPIEKGRHVISFLEQYGHELQNSFAVVSEKFIRIRK